MSDILDIYDSIAAFSPTGVKTTRNIDEVKLAVNKGLLPLRILLPSTTGEGKFIDIGKLQGMTWSIRDICLWAPLSDGFGIEQYAEDMVTYISSYIAQVKANRAVATTSVITGFTMRMGPVPWGNDDYWAVDITLTVEEVL